VIITLLAATGFTVSSTPAVVTIVDPESSRIAHGSAAVTHRALSSDDRYGAATWESRGPLVVRLAYSGSASRSTDYNAPDSVTIPNGASNATFRVSGMATTCERDQSR
jgi:hypothetical protein